MLDTSVRSIRITGRAKAPFDRVSFKITVSDIGSTAKKAKDMLAESVQELELLFDQIKAMPLNVLPQFTRKSMDTSHQGAKRFHAQWTLSFMIDAPDQAAAVHSILNQRDDVDLAPPDFSISSVEALKAKAFASAVSKANKQFEMEKATVGWGAHEHKISRIAQANYDISAAATAIEPQRKALYAMSNGLESAMAPAPPPTLEPGKAIVSVTCEFEYTLV